MDPQRIGIQLASLELPLREAIAHAGTLGVGSVELDVRGELHPRRLSQSGIRQIRKWLNDYGLRVSAVSFRTRRGYDVLEDLQPRLEATIDAMRLAYAFGASLVVNQVGTIPEDEQSVSWQTLLGALSELGRASLKTGAWLAMETGTDSGQEMRRLLDALPEGSALVTFDPANLIINRHSPVEAIQALGSDIAHVHAKDAVQDLAQGRGVEVPLGRGSAEWPELVGLMEQYDYQGSFTVEREGTAQKQAEIVNAVEYLKQLG